MDVVGVLDASVPVLVVTAATVDPLLLAVPHPASTPGAAACGVVAAPLVLQVVAKAARGRVANLNRVALLKVWIQK